MTDFSEKLCELVLGGVGGLATGVIPEHLRRQGMSRLSDFNPFDIIKGNDDLTRAVRLAWIEAALAVLDAARSTAAARNPGTVILLDFVDTAERDLKLVRQAAWDRRGDAGISPIDRHAEEVLSNTHAFLLPGSDKGLAHPLTKRFDETLAAIVRQPVGEIPTLPAEIAEAGLPTIDGGARRSFGELVFAAFAELLKNPTKYPEAGVAFHAAMAGATLELSRRLEAHVRKVDDKLDSLPATVVAELMAALDARGVTAVATASGLEREIVLKLAQRLKPKEVLDFPQSLAEVENAIDIAIGVIQGAARGSNSGDFLDVVLRRVANQVSIADFEGAAREIDAELSTIDEREEHLRRSRVKLLEEAIQVDLLRRDPPRVAWRIRQVAALLHPSRLDAQHTFLEDRWTHYYEEGDRRGISLSLEVAIEIARRAISTVGRVVGNSGWHNRLGSALSSLGDREGGTARLEEAVTVLRETLKEHTRELMPLEWAAAQNSLGTALQRLGERESGTAHLEAAVTALREALKEHTRERMPLQWAATQNNLGIALQSLGSREGGTARLEEAIAAFRAALEECTRERKPLQWAATQTNLGMALQSLGVREGGTARLEEAVVAFRAALEEHTRERMPVQWAGTKFNLGIALQSLGVREGGTARLEEAVVALREALKEHTRERMPFKWASVQYALGATLQNLGDHGGETAHLEEAVTAQRAALEEHTRERVPLEWAAAQNELGVALNSLGDLEEGTARLEEAVVAFRAALQERIRKRMPLQWANTQVNLGIALAGLGYRESGTVRLKEAVRAFRLALVEYTRERVPLQWATTQINLGGALSTLGNREGGTAHLKEAVTAFRAALQECTRERAPLQWAAAQNNLGAALHGLGSRESGTARLEEAVAAYLAALQEYTRERAPLQWAMTQTNLGAVLRSLGDREGGTERLEEAAKAFRSALEEFIRERVPPHRIDAQEQLDIVLALLVKRRDKCVPPRMN